jgi:hypothetical protein
MEQYVGQMGYLTRARKENNVTGTISLTCRVVVPFKWTSVFMQLI